MHAAVGLDDKKGGGEKANSPLEVSSALATPTCIFKLLDPALADISTWPLSKDPSLNIYQERVGLLVASLAKPLLESLVSKLMT